MKKEQEKHAKSAVEKNRPVYFPVDFSYLISDVKMVLLFIIITIILQSHVNLVSIQLYTITDELPSNEKQNIKSIRKKEMIKFARVLKKILEIVFLNMLFNDKFQYCSYPY